MIEMYLRHFWFTCSACVPFTQNEERILKFKKKILDTFIKGSFMMIPKRAASNKKLRDQAFNIAKFLEYDACQRVLASLILIFVDKTFITSVSKPGTYGGTIKNKVLSNQNLLEELHKPITKNFRKYKL